MSILKIKNELGNFVGIPTIKGEPGADGLDINWLGAYNGSTSYVINDAVSYNGSSYICKLASTGNLPTNTTYFDLMAQKGETGSGVGDMLKSVYDPSNKNSDAFDMANMVEGTTNKIFTATERTKLSGIADNANNYSLPTASNLVLGGVKIGDRLTITDGVLSADNQSGGVSSVNSQTGTVVLDADDISDASTTNKFMTSTEKTKLSGIAEGAEVNVNADWNAVSGDAQILNKPTIPVITLNGTQTTSPSFFAPSIGGFAGYVLSGNGTANSPYWSELKTINSTSLLGSGDLTISEFTDEKAQDAVGGILTDSGEIDFTYDDATPSISASLKSGSIDESKLDTSVNASLDLADSALQTTDIIDNLTSTSTTDALSAKQGKVLNDKFTPVVLYDNGTTGTNGTVTLSETAANFTYLEIFYRDGANGYYSTKIYSPNGKTVRLVGIETTANTATYWLNLKGEGISISGTSITVGNSSEINFKSTGAVYSTTSTTPFYITRVEGYR